MLHLDGEKTLTGNRNELTIFFFNHYLKPEELAKKGREWLKPIILPKVAFNVNIL